MSGEVVALVSQRRLSAEEIAVRLRRMASILAAIYAGELLSALPEAPDDRTNHLAALDLIGILEVEIGTLCHEIELTREGHLAFEVGSSSQ